MKKLVYKINDKEITVNVDDSLLFKIGDEKTLSTKNTDISYDQPWYKKGYTTANFLNKEDFNLLLEGLTESIKKLINIEFDLDLSNFELHKYHHYIKTNEDHFKIASKTRDLFPNDFNFNILEILPKFESILGFKLTDINPFNKQKAHIIVRINRPFSKDFNPPHKDIYEGVDNESYIPQFINLWIPICGVTQNSSLPVAPESHLLSENKIKRTFDGAIVEGNKYRVRMIESWDSNKLFRTNVKYGEVLFLSSHLVHGLAINQENDTTRVALEFRLFKEDTKNINEDR